MISKHIFLTVHKQVILDVIIHVQQVYSNIKKAVIHIVQKEPIYKRKVRKNVLLLKTLVNVLMKRHI